MGFTVEQECPQCGAPIDLDETDRLIRCPYCEVKNFIFFTGNLRFVLPNKAPDKDLIYVPYLRFRGSVYYCSGQDVGYRIVDLTRLGIAVKGIPGSLGIRPQALKMRFLTPDIAGGFLKFSLNPGKMIESAGRLSSLAASGEMFHRAFIGETVSIIYLPTYIDGNRLFDGIVNRPIVTFEDSGESFAAAVKQSPRWKISFLPTLCPACGWNLEGQRDSIVLACRNCDRAWAPSNAAFVQVKCYFMTDGDKESIYLPFWRIAASSEGIEINSYADFIRQTNQPKVVREEWNDIDMCFWSPAFKVRPKIFLSLSRQLTVFQEPGNLKEGLPKGGEYPVTLALSESIQGMKTVLAHCSIKKKKVIPKLPTTSFSVKSASLVYLPFTVAGSEMIQEQMGTCVNKNTLEFGRHL